MRKALRIISVVSGIVSVVSAVVLAYVYMEDVVGFINDKRTKE